MPRNTSSVPTAVGKWNECFGGKGRSRQYVSSSRRRLATHSVRRPCACAAQVYTEVLAPGLKVDRDAASGTQRRERRFSRLRWS